jgi:hypothetical protein
MYVTYEYGHSKVWSLRNMVKHTYSVFLKEHAKYVIMIFITMFASAVILENCCTNLSLLYS